MDSYDNDWILLMFDDDLFPTEDENESCGTAFVLVEKGDDYD